jgi:hypothetical protein
MKPVQRPLANDTLYRRIDEMPISITDRELAKARLQTGDRFAEAICELGGAIRSCAAFVARRVRTAVVPS